MTKKIRAIKRPPIVATVVANNLLDKHFTSTQTWAEEGRPVAWISGDIPASFFFCMGILPVYPQYLSSMQAVRGDENALFEIMEGKWEMPVDTCSEIKSILGAAELNGPEGSRTMPKPNFLIGTNGICSQIVKGFEFLSQNRDIQNYTIDIPAAYAGDYTTASITYVEQQLQALAEEMGEKHGLFFDQEKFIKFRKNSHRIYLVWEEIYKLSRTLPSPIDGQDLGAFFLPYLLMDVAEQGDKILEMLIMLYNELCKTVQKNEGNEIPRERHRLMWYSLGIYKSKNFIKRTLAQFDASIVLTSSNYTEFLGEDLMKPLLFEYPLSKSQVDQISGNSPHLEQGSELEEKEQNPSPFHYFAERYLKLNFKQDTLKELQGLKRMIEAYEIDGVIMHMNQNCRTLSLSQPQIMEYLIKELETPTLMLHADSMDERHFSLGQITTRLEAFLEDL